MQQSENKPHILRMLLNGIKRNDKVWVRKVVAACRDNFHLLILFSYHPFISSWLMVFVIKVVSA